jgi:protocatechuate 3,4-dioxygenase beta subunit
MQQLIHLFRTRPGTLTRALVGIIFIWIALSNTLSAAAQPLPDRMNVVGRVLDVNGAPVGGAAVSLRRRDEIGAAGFWGTVVYSDARGGFFLADAEMGSYYLAVDAPGYVPIMNRAIRIGTDANVYGESLSDLRLTPLANLRVHVLGVSGEPLSQQPIAMLFRPLDVEEGIGAQIQRAVTDVNSNALFQNLIPGTYSVLAVIRGNGYVEFNSLRIDSQSKKNVQELRLRRGGTLRVQAVSGKNQRGVGGSGIQFQRTSSPNFPESLPGSSLEMQLYTAPLSENFTREGDGVLEMADLAPGGYRVEIEVQGVNRPTAQIATINEGKTTEVTFQTDSSASADLQIQVNDRQGRPISDTKVAVTLQQLSSPYSGAIMPKSAREEDSDRPHLVRQERRGTTDKTGKITLYPLGTGRWTVSVRRDIAESLNAVGEVEITANGGSLALALRD